MIKYPKMVLKSMFMLLLFLIIFVATPILSRSYADQIKEDSSTSNSSREFKKIYECSKKVFYLNENLEHPIDVRILKDDLFFILDGDKNELYIFTPYFAGKANLDLDKDGKKIEISGDYGSLQYNVRIPYSPKGASSPTGYFYMTINDRPYNGHHDARINLPPRFLPNAAQEKPDFSKMEPTKNGVTLLQADGQDLFAPSKIEYHPLDIEDKIWNQQATNNFDESSKAILISEINLKIKGMGSAIEEMGVGMGMGHWDAESMKKQMEQYGLDYKDTINVCQDVAKELSLTSIQEAIDSQKNDSSQAECVSSQTPWKWHNYKSGLDEFKMGDATFLSRFSIGEITGLVNCTNLYSVLNQYLNAFKTCHVPESLPVVGAAFRAEFEINPDGQINQETFKAYALNVTADNYTGCLYPALRSLKFKKMDDKPTKLLVTFSIGKK